MFTVSVDLDGVPPVSREQMEDLLDSLVEFGAAITGTPGGTTIGSTMTVEADDALLAGAIAAARMRLTVGASRVVGCEALTVEEFDRRQALLAC